MGRGNDLNVAREITHRDVRGGMMAKIQIENVVDHLSSEMRRALQDAVSEVLPGADFDAYELFRAFRRAVGRKCNTWESVPDRYVNNR